MCRRTTKPACHKQETGVQSCVRKIPRRRALEKQTPVFLPGESHGQISLAGYSPWGRKESDTKLSKQTTELVQPGAQATTGEKPECRN